MSIKNIFLIFISVVFVANCSHTKGEKKQFIEKKIQKTIDKNAKKHNELIIPQFLLDGKYKIDGE